MLIRESPNREPQKYIKSLNPLAKIDEKVLDQALKDPRTREKCNQNKPDFTFNMLQYLRRYQ